MATDVAKAIVTMNELTQRFDDAVVEAEPFWPTLCTEINSTHEEETYAWLLRMRGMVEWLGERQYQDLSAARYTIANKLWEDSLSVEETKIEDDSVGIYRNLATDFGTEAAHHPDDLTFEIMQAGDTTTCYDGQNFFDTDHQTENSGLQSNKLEHDVVSTTAVTPAEFRAAYNKGINQMLKYRDNLGRPYLRPRVRKGMPDIICLVPVDMQDAADMAFNAQLIGGDSNRVVNRPRSVETINYLSDQESFYILNVGKSVRPFVFQRRRPLRRQVKGIGDYEFKDVKLLADARYNVGYGLWQTAVKVTVI